MDRRLNKPLILAMVAVALILGVLLGITTGVADRIFGGPDPTTIASASLESMRTQNRLTVFAARYVSVVTSQQDRLGGLVSSQRTLILPGDVRYELDLAKLQPKDVTWQGSSNTLTIELPDDGLPFGEAELDLEGRSRVVAAGNSELCRQLTAALSA